MRRFFILFFVAISVALSAATPHDNFIIVTPEKTGTHLLTKALSQLIEKECINCWKHQVTGKELIKLLDQAKKENAFLQMHALPTSAIIKTLKDHNYKVIFLLRDPRDQALSLLHFIEKGWAYGPLRNEIGYGKLTMDEKLDEIISGRRFGLSATKSIIGRRIPWLYQDQSFVHTVRFEELVGKEGGGSRDWQIREAFLISKFLNTGLSWAQATVRSRGLFGKPREGTFRSGKIGNWKNEFTELHKEAMKAVFGKELIEIGYASDFNW